MAETKKPTKKELRLKTLGDALAALDITVTKEGDEPVTESDMLATLKSTGWHYVNVQEDTRAGTTRIALFRACALPARAIALSNKGYLLHDVETMPASNETRFGIEGFYTTDKRATAARFWDALDKQRVEISGEMWYSEKGRSVFPNRPAKNGDGESSEAQDSVTEGETIADPAPDAAPVTA